MRKNDSSAVENDKDLEKFETDLKLFAKAGEIPYSVSEKEIEELSIECTGLTLPPELEEKYMASMKKAYEDLAIEKARTRLHAEVKIFGRHIQHIRKEAGITASRIADRLSKAENFVERIESGALNPLQLAKETIADLMELFKIHLRELASAIQMSLEAPPMAEGAHARAANKGDEKERLEDISIAMEDLMVAASRKEAKKVTVPEDFLNNIKKELERRGRADLII